MTTPSLPRGRGRPKGSSNYKTEEERHEALKEARRRWYHNHKQLVNVEPTYTEQSSVSDIPQDQGSETPPFDAATYYGLKAAALYVKLYFEDEQARLAKARES